MFSANQNFTTTQGLTFYASDYCLSPLMCADSFQICAFKAGGGSGAVSCTKLTSIDKLIDGFESIDLNAHQYWTASLISEMLLTSSIYGAVYGRGPSALKAQRSIVTLADPEQQIRLPFNQWHQKLKGGLACPWQSCNSGWFSMCLDQPTCWTWGAR